jgi:glycosyltransferase involved in cell wall biosynthesis
MQVDQRMLREKVAEASFVRAISTDGRDFIAQHADPGAASKIEIVPCGIDTAAFGPVSPGSPRPADKIPNVLCVATLYEVKGHEYLLQACARLVARGRPVACRLVGDGPDRPKLERRIAELGLGTVITLLGPRPRAEVIALMHEADVLVVPSVPTGSGRREGLPVVIMEALAAGLPVVASAISGIPEVVHDGVTGLLVPPRDPDALATAIERATTEGPERRRWIAAGRDLVRDRYDFEVVSERLIGLFRANAAPDR